MHTAPKPIPFGPFDLSAPAGRGGMGVVWRGLHRATLTPVAVKVLTSERALDRRFLGAFQREVRAMAGLDHPGIVRIFDYGRAPVALPDSGDAGSPFLVMEWVPAGHARPWMEGARWASIRPLLLALLDALAHAHARGLVHRDLKPENVLWTGQPEGVKLTDFGLAHPVDDDPGDRRRAAVVQGTPAYMAPEQVQGLVRDLGPWTDLYALGCMAYEMVCGRRPFGRDSALSTLVAHLTRPPPPFEPQTQVPEGFEAWVRALMARSPADRPQRAADAAKALLELGSAPVDLALEGTFDQLEALADGPAVEPQDAHLSTAGYTLAWFGGGSATDTATSEPAVSDTTETPMAAPPTSAEALAAAPMPADWRRPGHSGATLTEVPTGVGLGVYALRAMPLVGRLPERDQLWAALRQADEGAPVVVVLRGSSGYGKSRLAEWLCQRAHELGAATPLKAFHGPGGGRAFGLGPMVARWAGSRGLSPQEAGQRVEAGLRRLGATHEAEWQALTAVAHPTESPLPPADAWAALGRWLVRLGRDRPSVVWLDDVQHAPRAVGFARWLLSHGAGQGSRALVLLTVQEEGLGSPEAAEAREALEALESLQGVIQVTLGPLSEAERPALMQALLGLEGDLAWALDERTGGNPMFAVQLVGDWVQRGLLLPGPGGFRLRPEAQVDLPADLHEVWATRVDRLLEGRPEGEARALELAATLGQRVDAEEWQAAGARLDPPMPPAEGLVDALLRARLAQVEEAGPTAGWTFVHGMLRESLAQRAINEGRAPALHRACAEMLESLGQTLRPPPRAAERAGQHWLAARRPERALDPLADGARARLAAADYREAERLLDAREAALTALGIAEADPRHPEGWLLRCEILRLRGRLEAAAEVAQRLAAGRQHPEWAPVEAALLAELGCLAKDRGALTEAEERLSEALAVAMTRGQAGKAARCQEELGWSRLAQGRSDEAHTAFSAALSHHLETLEARAAGRCLVGLSRVAKRRRRFDDAFERLREARTWFERAGSPAGAAACANQLGEVARLLGRLAEAETHYRAAERIYTAIGSGNAVFPRTNLALTLIERDRPAEARPLLEAALADFVDQGRVQYEAALRVCLLPCLVDAPEVFDGQLAVAESLFEQTEAADVDAARMAARAGDWMAARGDEARARAAWRLARAQWAGLDRPDEVAQVEALLAGPLAASPTPPGDPG